MPRTITPAKYKNNAIRIEREGAKNLRKLINEWMQEMRRMVIKGLNKQIRKDQADSLVLELTDWEIVETKGIVKIKPAILDIVSKAGENTTRLFSIEASFDALNMQAVELAETITATMVREVTNETRKGISYAIRDGLQGGRSIPQIAKSIKPLVGLTETQIISIVNYEEQLLIDRPTWNRAQIDRSVNKYERKKHRQRTQTIARTESSTAMNEGSLNVYESEEVDVEWIAVKGNEFDPEECQDNDGKIFSIAEARGRIPVHPNCECLWGPHVKVAA